MNGRQRRNRDCYSAAAVVCLRHDTVPTTLHWERLPERQQRTQEEPAPCELGLSAVHSQETAAHTHTHSTLPEQLLPQQSPLCSFNRDSLPGPPTTRAEERDRHTKSDTTDKHAYCRGLAVTNTILMAEERKRTKLGSRNKVSEFKERKWPDAWWQTQPRQENRKSIHIRASISSWL